MTQAKRKRRGASITEMAIILTVFVITTFGMLDLGIGVFRYHILSNAARQGARRAIVHGEKATLLGTWGPATTSTTASATGVPIVDGATDGLKPMLLGCDLQHTTITLTWLDGSNAIGKRVQCTVTSPYQPFMFFLVPVTLSATSTMQIAH